jgi:hypothetical protein
MKNLILVIAFGLFAFAGTTNAQNCSHASKAVSEKTCVKPSEAALKAASMDANIETKVCEKSGKVCFLKKSTDSEGNVASTEVRYDEATAQFVSIVEGESSADATSGAVKSCSKSKACCSKSAKAGKACCKSKGTASASAPENSAPAQNIKSE